MCGIAGILHYSRDASSALDADVGLRMLEAIAHRGPDDGGLLVAPHLLLGHRRLAILDLSPKGHQPMTDERQDCWIVFNGEIYNFRELRSELESCGHRFLSMTDTEVLLRSYLEWGHACVHRLNGMFAFGVYDRRDESLWLVRDPVGIKPLFYSDAGGLLRFGSEIKAILADPAFIASADWRGLDRFFTFGYTPAPWTGFAGISQLLPGHDLLVRDGRVEIRRWYRPPLAQVAAGSSLADAADQLETVLDAAVRRQMASDVPLGAFLSGGLDSSAIVGSMRRSGAREIDTFTIGFAESSFDESAYARQVAETFAVRHHEERLDEHAAAALLHTVVSHAEEPFADNSAIAVYCVSEFARRHVTVALSGDGADELLAGYETYYASALAPYFRRIPWPLRAALSALIRSMPTSTAKYGAVAKARRFLDGASRPFPYDHCSWRRYLSAEQREAVYTEAYRTLTREDPLDDYAGVLRDAPGGLSDLEQRLFLDFHFHLPNDMLVKVDRMSMAHGLEVRVPFLDLEVVRACAGIPSAFKRRGRDGKRVLKSILERDLPADFVRRKKAGFLVPIEKWLRGEWRELLKQTLSRNFVESTGMLHYGPIESMIRQQAGGRADLAYPLYALFIFAIWWRIWISREIPPALRRHSAKPVHVVALPPREGR